MTVQVVCAVPGAGERARTTACAASHPPRSGTIRVYKGVMPCVGVAIWERFSISERSAVFEFGNVLYWTG